MYHSDIRNQETTRGTIFQIKHYFRLFKTKTEAGSLKELNILHRNSRNFVNFYYKLRAIGAKLRVTLSCCFGTVNMHVYNNCEQF